MPEKDYLGKDQRRTKDVEKKDDKPIKGNTIIFKIIYIFSGFQFKIKIHSNSFGRSRDCIAQDLCKFNFISNYSNSIIL